MRDVYYWFTPVMILGSERETLMHRFRAGFILPILILFVLGGCSANAATDAPASAEPTLSATTSVPTVAATPTLNILPSSTPEPTSESVGEELAPVGHYEVLTRNGETTVHIWLE